MKDINLVKAPSDRELEIREINSGSSAKQRLISMGLHVGDKLVKFNGSSWGPVLVKNVTVNSSKIAIGRRLATFITVGYEET